MNNIYVAIVVPRNVLNLYCSAKYNVSELNIPENCKTPIEILEQYAPGDVYDLSKIDPERFKEILHIIHAASDNQLIIAPTADNLHCEARLSEFNDNNPQDAISKYDIIRMADASNYKGSTLGYESGHYPYEELHAFEHIKVPGFSTSMSTTMYVKFVAPEEASNITVESFHRPGERKYMIREQKAVAKQQAAQQTDNN